VPRHSFARGVLLIELFCRHEAPGHLVAAVQLPLDVVGRQHLFAGVALSRAAVEVHRELTPPSLGSILLLAIIVGIWDFLLDVLLLLSIIRILKLQLSPHRILLILPAQVTTKVIFIAEFTRLSVLLLFLFQTFVSELLVIL
jgi:hypothetical protein